MIKTDTRGLKYPGANTVGTQIPLDDGSTDLQIEHPWLGGLGEVLAGSGFEERVELRDVRLLSAVRRVGMP